MSNLLSAKLAALIILTSFSLVTGNVFAQSGNSTAIDEIPAPDPEIDINAGFATFSYGVVFVGVTIENAIPDQTGIEIEFYNPDGELEGTESQTISIQNGTGMTGCYCFGIERQYVEENYEVVVIYGDYSETEVMAPFSSAYPQPPTISFHAADQNSFGIHIGGRVSGGIAGEQVNVAIYPEEESSPLWDKTVDSNTKVIFDTDLPNEEAEELLSTGTYRVVATHISTGITGETTLDYTNPSSQEEPQPEPAPEPQQPEAPQQDNDVNDEQEEPEDDNSDGTIRSPFVFDEEEDDSPVTPASTSSASTSTAQADELALVINGTLASYYILDNATAQDMTQLYILSGNWSMTVNSTAVSDFAANFTIVRADGVVRSAYSIANFTAVNASDVQLDSDSVILASSADIQKDDNATTVNLLVTIEKFNFIKIEFGDDLSQPAGRPIYGVVDSLATVNNGELSVVPR
jgi:hypothetical protein